MAKSPKAEEADGAAQAAAPKSGGKSKRMIIVAGAALLAAGGGGGAWFLMKGKHAEGEAQANPVKKERRVDKGAPPVFLPLDPFVVNLHNTQPGATDKFLQTDMTLRLAGADVVEEIKAHMPEVRDRVLMLLSSKTSAELLTPEGKAKLAEAVRVEITAVVDPEAVKAAPKPKLKKEDGDKAEGGKEGEAREGEAKDAKEGGEAPAEEAQSPEDYKVRSVLFTSFIIQ